MSFDRTEINSHIASLPDNTYDYYSPDKEVLNIADSTPILNVADYSDKSFVVFGDGTKIHKQNLKLCGGKFNYKLKEKPGFPGGPAWIFPTVRKDVVLPFVEQVNNGIIKTQQTSFDQGDEKKFPIVVMPIKNNKYQTVRWKVFKPSDGMTAIIKANGKQTVAKVLQTETHKNVVDTAYISINENTSKLVICNGQWKVCGYMIDHTVFFEDLSTQGTNTDTNAT